MAFALFMGTGPFLIRWLTQGAPTSADAPAELAAITERLNGVVAVVMWVLAGVSLAVGVGYWFVCRRAHRAWRSLPEHEREELTRKRIDRLNQALVALGGIAPDALPIRLEDLDGLNDRHRRLLEGLRAKAEKTTSPICGGARARTEDLVMAGRLHRALSNDTIVRPPHTASAATDPRVLALVELDDEIQAAAAAIGEALEAGRCNCDQDTHRRLIRAGDRAHAVLHGLDPETPELTRPRPRWIGRLTWTGVALCIAALPIGLLTAVPSVLISAAGMTVAGVGFIAASWHNPGNPHPISALRRGLFVAVWIAVLAAAALALLA
ncbi:hypothetical protein [Nocardioides sp.]|uniref:hypothetical protein n=1 Tax=Nocardioides sp. TaxID=35761 RepID=UPI00262D5127|nr:hypothetical protein [Nocardioides sp.]